MIDGEGDIVDRWALRHDAAGLDAAIARLATHGRPEDLPIAIETTSGLVVDRLLAVGHAVVPIHPNAFNAARPRWGASRAKSDPGDSFKLADYLRTDGRRLRRLAPLDAATAELQALSRLARRPRRGQGRSHQPAHGTAGPALAGSSHDLRPPGRRDRPGLLGRLPHADGGCPPWRGADEDVLSPVLLLRRRSPAELLDRLRAAPEPTQALSQEILVELVRAQVRLLRSLLRTIADLDRALGAALLERLFKWAERFPQRTWASRTLLASATRSPRQLVAAGEGVLDGQSKLAARVRLLATQSTTRTTRVTPSRWPSPRCGRHRQRRWVSRITRR